MPSGLMDPILDASLLALPLDDLTISTIANEFWEESHAQGRREVTNELSAFRTYYTKEVCG